jgi:hypothetical protein
MSDRWRAALDSTHEAILVRVPPLVATRIRQIVAVTEEPEEYVASQALTLGVGSILQAIHEAAEEVRRQRGSEASSAGDPPVSGPSGPLSEGTT